MITVSDDLIKSIFIKLVNTSESVKDLFRSGTDPELISNFMENQYLHDNEISSLLSLTDFKSSIYGFIYSFLEAFMGKDNSYIYKLPCFT